jgi:hypothetical protein
MGNKSERVSGRRVERVDNLKQVMVMEREFQDMPRQLSKEVIGPKEDKISQQTCHIRVDLVNPSIISISRGCVILRVANGGFRK